MKTILLALLLLPALVSAMEVSPYTAHYEVRFSGLGGEATAVLTKADDATFIFENRTRAKGLARLARPRDVVERSEFKIENSELKPISFTSEDGTKRNKRGSNIDFDWTSNVANSEYKDETEAMELQPGLLDRQLMQVAMMSDLSNGLTEAAYTVIDRHSIKTYEISVLGTETVEVPAGTFEALKIERAREGSSRATIIWCAPSLGYVAVKMEQLKDGDVIGTLSLTDIR